MSRLAGLLGILLGCAACATTTSRLGLPPPETAPQVDLARYAGTWFEIAAFPTRFQRDCMATQATYTPREDGTIGVRNACRRGSLDGPESAIDGVAWSTNPPRNTKLAVRFFWPFTGDYWILAVDDAYRWALVGHPSRDYLWVLSRQRAMDEATYQMLVARATALGFDPSRLVRTVQPG